MNKEFLVENRVILGKQIIMMPLPLFDVKILNHGNVLNNIVKSSDSVSFLKSVECNGILLQERNGCNK